MTRKTKNIILASVGAVALVAVAAGAGAYVTQEVINDDKPVAARQVSSNAIEWNGDRRQEQAPQRVASNCDDGNIVGTVLGGLGGGILGNQIGSGSGNTAATIGGAVGGAALGNRYIPTDNETCDW